MKADTCPENDDGLANNFLPFCWMTILALFLADVEKVFIEHFSHLCPTTGHILLCFSQYTLSFPSAVPALLPGGFSLCCLFPSDTIVN